MGEARYERLFDGDDPAVLAWLTERGGRRSREAARERLACVQPVAAAAPARLLFDDEQAFFFLDSSHPT